MSSSVACATRPACTPLTRLGTMDLSTIWCLLGSIGVCPCFALTMIVVELSRWRACSSATILPTD